MDEATARLIIELQNQDIEELLKESHEETTEQASIDHDLALSIYKTELSDRATILGDRRMARSICLANLRDGATITAQRALEQQTVDDRSAAARMVNLLPPPVPANHRAQVNVEEQSVHLIPQQEQPAGPKQSCDTSESGGSKNGNSQFLQDPIDERIARLLQEETLRILEATPKIECVACTDSFVTAHLVKLPCQHHYCKECVPRFFENAIQHEGSWPPRCRNQRIPMIDVRRFLSNDLRARYAVKSLEWSTSNRTYGHEVTCSTFVPPDTIEDTCATCPICGRNTCTSCKRPQHDGACVEDQGLAQVRGLATENRWQRCYSCRRYVELNTGRNHITYVVLSFHIRSETDHPPAAIAELNSAMSVLLNGRTVCVRYGMNADS